MLLKAALGIEIIENSEKIEDSEIYKGKNGGAVSSLNSVPGNLEREGDRVSMGIAKRELDFQLHELKLVALSSFWGWKNPVGNRRTYPFSANGKYQLP